jgi:hypothetical protein
MFCCWNKDEVVDGTESVRIRKSERMCDHYSTIFFQNCHGRIHFALLCLYFLIMVAYGVVLMMNNDSAPDSISLCVSLRRQLFVIFSVALPTLGIFGPIGLLILMCRLVETVKKAREAICSILVICIYFLPFVFVLAVISGFKTNVLINGPNNSYHLCDISLNLFLGSIISSSDIINSTNMNQTCQFWPVGQFCDTEKERFSFIQSAPLITINGTLGAYLCQPPTSMGSHLCETFLAGAYNIWIATLICCPLSVPLLVIVGCWIGNATKLGFCERCYKIWKPCICRKCCTCCKEYMPLLAEEEEGHGSASAVGGM